MVAGIWISWFWSTFSMANFLRLPTIPSTIWSCFSLLLLHNVYLGNKIQLTADCATHQWCQGGTRDGSERGWGQWVTPCHPAHWANAPTCFLICRPAATSSDCPPPTLQIHSRVYTFRTMPQFTYQPFAFTHTNTSCWLKNAKDFLVMCYTRTTRKYNNLLCY